MSNTPYTILLKILGLWFVNHTSEKIKHRQEIKRKKSMTDEEKAIELKRT